MAVKCDITKYALRSIANLRYAYKCVTNPLEIGQSYIEHLNCPTVEAVPCKHSDCTNNPIVYLCNISISGILSERSGDTYVFKIAEGQVTNGVPPYTYYWKVDRKDFIPTTSINGTTLTAKLRAGKNPAHLVSKVSVSIIDAEECETTKDCYITPTGMECGDFVECPNPIGLKVTNKVTSCPKPMMLKVTKKI